MSNEKILACIYAGDPNDEYCSTCDGITMVVDEGTLPATECGGYEAPKEVVQPAPSTTKPAATKPATTKPAATATKPASSKSTVKGDIPGTTVKGTLPAQNDNAPWEKQQPDPAKPRETNESTPVNTNVPQQNNVVPYFTKEIHAESGITMEIKNGNGTSTWYKLAYAETRVVAENLDSELLEQAKKDLWDTVNGEVDRQTAEIYEMLQNTK